MCDKSVLAPECKDKNCEKCFEPSKNKHAVSLGSLGGLATAKAMTPEQRSERAKKAVRAREEKRKKSN